ncbi:MAG: hypothetical protein K8T20_00390 [Planctomycetes bacterium]|nr:hypothetical protein [Planctomycetota bacterium]
MTELEPGQASAAPATDLPSVMALSSLAYIAAVFLHEICGHGFACVLLGIRLTELGSFYVASDHNGVSELQLRMVAAAGPAMSAMTGLVAWAVLRFVPVRQHHARYFCWLLGCISLLAAAGYLLFSGITGIGDLGTTEDGALYQLRPTWLWRAGIAVVGGVCYFGIALVSVRKLDGILGGGTERFRRARRLAFTSYLTGGVVSVLIGLLNPHGLFIVFMSAAASSFGGTSGLIWMTRMLDRHRPSPATAGLLLPRSWPWIVTAILVTAAYTLILGRTIYL